MSSNIPVTISKICILLLGAAVLVLGVFSHFTSMWVRDYGLGYKPYTMCDIKGVPNCPHISKERYHVSIIIITFILSVVSLVAPLFVTSKTQNFKWIDLGYQVVASILVLIGAVNYIQSAVQIQPLIKLNATLTDWRTTEKLWAGSLAVFQSLLYAVTALLILKGN